MGSRGNMGGGQSGVRLASHTCSKARDQTTQDHMTLIRSDGLLILDHCWAFTRGLTRDFTRGFARGFTHNFTRDLASDLCLCSCICLYATKIIISPPFIFAYSNQWYFSLRFSACCLPWSRQCTQLYQSVVPTLFIYRLPLLVAAAP